MTSIHTALTRHAGVEVPLVCGAMYPCSNPELIAAVSQAGGLAIVQPIALIHAHGFELRQGLRRIRSLTDKPIGFNAIVERSSKVYEQRMRRWVDIALEEGVRFFVTALGNPRAVVTAAHACGGFVYHDVTARKWAEKARDAGVDGLVAVNARAGGHAGTLDPRRLFEDLVDLGLPIVCAGGIGDARGFVEAIELGYAGAQLGTRFIATHECTAHADYKRAILDARARDIVLTERLSGVPVAVIDSPYVRRVGTRAGPIARRLLRHPRGKHLMRTLYALSSFRTLARASARGASYRDYFQAGKSVEDIHEIEAAGAIVDRFAAALRAARSTAMA